jgi:GTPase involved in cell partitioning and DNA repair
MKNEFKFELNSSLFEELELYSELLKKDQNTILIEALEQYFKNEQKKLLEKNIEDENAMSNLDYDEFWDGVEL